MATSQHLHVINPSYCRGEDVLFAQFTKLPKELRLRIWEHSLQQHRLLEVKVEPPSSSGNSNAPPHSTTNTLNKFISGRNYTAIVQGSRLYSKLFRVTREARKAALHFYRVHIQCYLGTSEEETERTIKTLLYFNPEYDFVHLSADCRGQTFADFFYDLKAYDPKDVGLLNLALDQNGMTDLSFMENVSEAPARAAFVDSLSRLQQIIWVAESHAGRRIMGPLQDFRGVGVQFNHSMPIKGNAPSFNLLRHDPRPVGLELRYVVTASSDPRQMRVAWQQLLEKWDIRQAQPTRQRVLFAYKPVAHEEQIYDVETANKFLEKEEESWLGAQQQWHRIVMKFEERVPVESPEELAKAVRPAIGFWLFPAEALGDPEGDISGSKKVFDMRGYWPELALSHFS